MNKHTANSNHYNCIDPELEKLFISKAKKEIVCVYKILKSENKISSKRIIEIALSQSFSEECYGCASADNIFRALKLLQEKGFIIGHLVKGGYIWELLSD
ncbi:MAG: hypothetical protein ACFFDW_06425 [Candidatus Thorarchaeota archaeon]